MKTNHINTIVNLHLTAIVDAAIADRNLTYTDGTYTVRDLATADPAPAWGKLSDQMASVTIDHRNVMECKYADIFKSLVLYGAADHQFTFTTPKVETPAPVAPAAEKPKAKRGGGRKKSDKPAASKPKAPAKTKAPAKIVCIEKSKTEPYYVETTRELKPLNEFFCYSLTEKGDSRVYLHVFTNVKLMVGAVRGEVTEDTLPDKYLCIAGDGIKTAIEKGAIENTPHIAYAYEKAGQKEFAETLRNLKK